MSTPDFGFLAHDNLPSRETIVASCNAAGHDCYGIPLRNQPSGPIIAWVKFGGNTSVAEALTQDYVARSLIADSVRGVRVPRVYMAFERPGPFGNIGYIVMEYIDAPDCDNKDYKLVAKAVQTLISVKGPSSAPGPVGGGRITHNFFVDWKSDITYETVDELQQQINGIIEYMERGDTPVDLAADAQNGLYLCPSDIHPGNFKKCRDGTVVALDFGSTCFLPPVFFAVAVIKLEKIFSRRVAQHVQYPKSSDVNAMVGASYYSVPFQRNELGLPKALLRREKKLQNALSSSV